MHRDTQIGLAMSIVLIGFAAALCFPRDSNRQPADVAAVQSVETNPADLPVRVYGAMSASPVPSPANAVDVPFPSPPVGEFAASATSSAVPRTVPDNTATPDAPSTEAHPAPVEPVLAFQPDEDAPATEGATAEAPATVFHVVKSGDTLSGLAQEYLGSVARYPEIFDANRDQLDTPDDLKLGMRLRIPKSAAGASRIWR